MDDKHSEQVLLLQYKVVEQQKNTQKNIPEVEE